MTERKSSPVDGEADPPSEAAEAAPAAESPETAAAPESPEAAPAPESPEMPATVEALQEEVRRLQAEAEGNWRQFLHAAADLENYKKQALRAREEAVERTRRVLLTVILSVVDNVERALEYGGQQETGAIIEGIRMTHRQVLDLLANMGVRSFDSVGHPFDARYHEAVELVPPTEEYAAGTVVSQVQRGYLLGDEVLRPARVRVAREA